MCRANEQPELVFQEAYAAASKAKRDYLIKCGEEPMYCGFAWVKVEPARGGFVQWAKLNGHGSKAYNGGYSFWKPGNWPSSEEVGFQIYGQSMDVEEEGAYAFARVLRENGLNAYAESRGD